MAEIFEVPVVDTWVDINTVTGLAVGTALEIMNKGLYGVYVTESVTEPVQDKVGKPLTSISRNYAVATVLEGSDTVWVRCVNPEGTTLAVQEIVT